MTDQPAPDVSVVDNPAETRYDVLVDGTLAGFSVYTDVEDAETGAAQRIFHHTEIRPEHEGQGLASILTRGALTDTVAAGRRIVAVCPYVKRWVQTHHDVDESLDRVRAEHLRALR